LRDLVEADLQVGLGWVDLNVRLYNGTAGDPEGVGPRREACTGAAV
jgi:hypothetical protein